MEAKLDQYKLDNAYLMAQLQQLSEPVSSNICYYRRDYVVRRRRYCDEFVMVCVCVCVCVCMYVCMYVYICVYVARYLSADVYNVSTAR